MGCASSRFLNDDESGGGVIVGVGLSHHVVSLTSTTYGLLTTFDETPPPPSFHERTASALLSPSGRSPPLPPPPPPHRPPSARLSPHLRLEPEVIRTWELMSAGVEPATSTAVTSAPRRSLLRRKEHPNSPRTVLCFSPGKENCVSDRPVLPSSAAVATPLREWNCSTDVAVVGESHKAAPTRPRSSCCSALEMFPRRCPPGGESAVVVYTTTLRGIRKTFEDCNAVRAALEVLGVWFKERDVSMDMGFREELRDLLRGVPGAAEGRISLPRVFVRGRYVGGADEVLRIHEEGALEGLLEGLPRARPEHPCDACGGVRFLPCFRCCGGKKLAALGGGGAGRTVRCPECNENGLVQCPICC